CGATGWPCWPDCAACFSTSRTSLACPLADGAADFVTVPALRLIVLDRDGVINHDSDEFIRSPAEWKPIDGSLEAIALLSASGFTVAVASNQSGIGRKLFDRSALE